jgi:hypothetical protein
MSAHDAMQRRGRIECGGTDHDAARETWTNDARRSGRHPWRRLSGRDDPHWPPIVDRCSAGLKRALDQRPGVDRTYSRPDDCQEIVSKSGERVRQ